MLSLKQIEFYYQPIYNRELELHSFEMLSRLRNPDRMQGAEFIQAIEASEIIVDITLKQINVANELLDKGIDCIFSINVNEFTLGSERFINTACNTPVKHPGKIILEISEKIKLSGQINLVLALKKLDLNGYDLGLDDFFSAETTTLPIMLANISCVKADISIIRSYKESLVNEKLLKTMVYFCNLSSIPSVAEGVDSIETYYELYGMGIDLFQGYLFSKPVPLAEMLLLYKNKRFDMKKLQT